MNKLPTLIRNVPSGVAQTDIQTRGDNVGGNKTTIGSNNLSLTQVSLNEQTSPIAIWMNKLADEISRDTTVLSFIDTLQMYQSRISHDGIDGLEAKLKHSGRTDEIAIALMKKELFTRLLARYSMFDSAQQILAYLLSKVDQDYRAYVLPNIGSISSGQIDILFTQYVITPCSQEIKSGEFYVNPAIAAGMVYWLAEQCYIRWHV